MPPSGAYGYPIGHPCGHPLSNKVIWRKLIDPGGIEPQPIKLEFTIYPTELWIYLVGEHGAHACMQTPEAD